MRDLLQTLDSWRLEGHGAGRAVVVRTFGSAPRQEGAVLLVSDDGRLIGSVSGGCVEGAVAEAVALARATGNARVIRYGISDEQAWDVGLACGGTIDVLVEPDVPSAAIAAAAGSAGPVGRSVAVVTPLPAGSPPAQLGSHQAGPGAPPEAPLVFGTTGELLEGTTGDPQRDAALAAGAVKVLKSGRSRIVEAGERAYFAEAFAVPPRLVIVGATEIARSLVGLAAALGYERIVIDGRAAFATAERFPDVEQRIVDWPEAAFAAIDLGPNDAVAILSHDPKFDEPAIVDAFRRGARYVGAVGSRKTQADRRRRLLEAGLSDDQLAELHGPIGLDLGGREPAETALAILAEIVAERRGGSGSPMHSRAAAG
jgi:xanthine dehydrogenase accessory factor